MAIDAALQDMLSGIYASLKNVESPTVSFDFETDGPAELMARAQALIGLPVQKRTPYDESMASPTREELDAKLQTIEAKMDGRVASIEGKIDSMLAKVDGANKVAELTYQHITADLAESRTHTRGLKSTVIGAAVGSVLALAALNATMLSNMLASFESGKNTATALVQVSEQLKQTQEQLKAFAAGNGASGKR